MSDAVAPGLPLPRKAAAPRLARELILPALFFLAFALVPLVADGSYVLQIATRVMILALAALALDLVLGFGGLVSFGHAAFLGIGAYAAGILDAEGHGDIVYVLPAALGVAAVFGLFTGWVSLRTRGVAFIMITLAFGQMAFFLAQSLSAYGGDDGLTMLARTTVFGRALLADRHVFFYAVLATLIAGYALCRAITVSRFGRALRAARDNPVRVAALGFDVDKIRLGAYVASGLICTVAGVLLANQAEFVSPAYLSWQRSGELIFILVLGGVGRLSGALIGALVFLLLEEELAGLTEHWKMIFGAILIAVVLFTRGGILGFADRIGGRLRRG